MFGKLLLITVALSSLVLAQTFEWVNIVPLNIQTIPSYLYGTVAIDNSNNPVCARLIEVIDSYNLKYYGVVKIEKRNTIGSPIWENTIEGKADVLELIVDGENNTVCIGTYRDTISIDTAQLIHSGTGTGSFILKLDDSGNFIWIKDGTEFFSGYDVMTALTRDNLNNYLLGISNYPIESKIYRLDTNGNIISTIQQTGVETISDIDVDSFGNIWVTGFVFGNQQVSFNGLDTTATFTYNDYVVKYNSSGTPLWVRFVEDITVQDFRIETDNAGNAYLSGNLFISTHFGNLLANGPQWVYDYFVTKISPDGNFLWLNEIPAGNPSGDATIGNSNFLFCSEDGSTYITGFYRGTINFGNGVTLFPIGSNDIFVISYDPDGLVQWAKPAGSSSFDQGSSIAVDGSGNCYISGMVSENALFDTISVSGSYENLFLAKLNPGNVVSVENNLDEESTPVNDFRLYQNYPNPFNPSTIISWQSPVNSHQTLKVYDILGNEVATLMDEYKPAGTYEMEFDASELPSGVYFYTYTTENFRDSRKMVVMK